MARSRGETWGSRFGVIAAVAGSAVGLGNFLRFPGVAVANGGGAFLLPYFVALILIGIPLTWVEWTLGRHGGRHGLHSVPAILGSVGGRFGRVVGMISLAIPFVVFTYYGLIEAWCLRYAVAYASGTIDLGVDPAGWAAASSAQFASVSAVGADGAAFAMRLDAPWVFWALVFGLNLWLLRVGLSGGIERFCRWAMPAMAICAVVVLLRVLTLGTPDPAFPERNVLAGLGYLWNPNPSRLADFDTWMAAAGQVFFSLSLGFGVIVNYASYLKAKDDVVLTGLTAAATNEVFEVGFGGTLTVTAAFVFLGASGTTGGTFGLGFETLPIVFAAMGPVGRLVGLVWFSMLFLAAITSSLSMLQPLKAYLEERSPLVGRHAVLVIAGVAGLGSLWVMYFSHGLHALDTLDFWIGTFAVFVLGASELILFAWIFGVDRGLSEAAEGAEMALPRGLRFVLRWVAPGYLSVVLLGFVVQRLPDKLRLLASEPLGAATLAWVLGLLAALVLATRRSRAAVALPEGESS